MHSYPPHLRGEFEAEVRAAGPKLSLARFNHEYTNADVQNLWLGFLLYQRMLDRKSEKPVWDGTSLPPIGCDVLFDTNSSGEQVGTVTHYGTRGDLKGDKFLHRVDIHLVYAGTGIPNCRLLGEVRPLTQSTKVKAATLAVAG